MRRAVFNQKGGVGKSNIAVNLATVSVKAGVKTLLADLDVQRNSTHYMWASLPRHFQALKISQNQLCLSQENQSRF